MTCLDPLDDLDRVHSGKALDGEDDADIVAIFGDVVLKEFIVLDAVEGAADVFDFDEIAVLIFNDDFFIGARS